MTKTKYTFLQAIPLLKDGYEFYFRGMDGDQQRLYWLTKYRLCDLMDASFELMPRKIETISDLNKFKTANFRGLAVHKETDGELVGEWVYEDGSPLGLSEGTANMDSWTLSGETE